MRLLLDLEPLLGMGPREIRESFYVSLAVRLAQDPRTQSVEGMLPAIASAEDLLRVRLAVESRVVGIGMIHVYDVPEQHAVVAQLDRGAPEATSPADLSAPGYLRAQFIRDIAPDGVVKCTDRGGPRVVIESGADGAQRVAAIAVGAEDGMDEMLMARLADRIVSEIATMGPAHGSHVRRALTILRPEWLDESDVAFTALVATLRAEGYEVSVRQAQSHLREIGGVTGGGSPPLLRTGESHAVVVGSDLRLTAEQAATIRDSPSVLIVMAGLPPEGAEVPVESELDDFVGRGLRSLVERTAMPAREVIRLCPAIILAPGCPEDVLQLLVAMQIPRQPGIVALADWAEVADAVERGYRRLPLPPPGTAETSHRLAAHLAVNHHDRVGGTLYHDVSAMADGSARTGIQRVSAALSRSFARAHPGRYYHSRVGYKHFVLENRLLDEVLDIPESLTAEDTQHWPIRPLPGDWLLVSEIYRELEPWHPLLIDWRARGAKYAQVVHDLLPIRIPEYFDNVTGWFTEWLKMVTTHADLLICDSQASADDLRAWLVENPPERDDQPVVTFMRLGFDLSQAAPYPESLRRRPRGRRRVLTVGTIEPRKGVEVVLDAAEEIWSRGGDVEFVFLGRPGWADREVVNRLEAHDHSERPLTWLRDSSDVDLRLEYLNADLVVMASRGEGFGLPIVEALAHGTPVVARDLPVFRELLGPDGWYFGRDQELADLILRRLHSDDPIEYVPDRLVHWSDTAADVLLAIAEHGGR